MNAKLVRNPWVGHCLPRGLTMNKIYNVTKVFKANNYDEYVTIIDDNDVEITWHEDCFEILP